MISPNGFDKGDDSMIFGYSFLQIAWYFLAYSFIGWIIEVVYCTVSDGTIRNRGFLNGPVCPVYGIGMVIVLSILRWLGYSDVSSANALVLFFGGMLLASMVEFIAGWGLMKLFNMRWWDYSNRPFNLGGYICLKFSCYWGLGAILVIRIVHAPVSFLVENPHIDSPLLIVLLCIFYLIFVADVAGSAVTIVGINKKLGEIDELSKRLHVVSESLSNTIGANALSMDAKLSEARVQAALGKMELEEMSENALRELEEHSEAGRREIEAQIASLVKSLKGNLIIGSGRLLSAFPNASHVNYDVNIRHLIHKKEISDSES